MLYATIVLSALQLATTDKLSSLSNRRGFELFAEHALNVCIRLNLPVTLLFFDLNKFKQFGHAGGDITLIIFSSLLLDAFRDSDVIARLRGDEFVVLLANSDEAGTKK